jgi:enoyl-CoA hydratase/carnithine racemase
MEEVLLIDDVHVEDSYPKGGIISIWTLNRPNKLNALNHQLHEEIKKQCQRVESDDNIRVVVIKGAKPLPALEGKRAKPSAFAAGADISEFEGKNSDDVRSFFEDNGWEAVWRLSKPTIAMVDGFALGGGTELALSCDMRLASNDALKIGLVNHVFESSELESATISFAMNIAKKSPYTIKVAKRAIRASLDLPFSEGVLAERSEFVALFDTEDKEIGVKAFLERKNPKWSGR